MAARVIEKWCAGWRRAKALGSHWCFRSPLDVSAAYHRDSGWCWLMLVDVEHNWVETERPQSSERQLWQRPQALGQIVPSHPSISGLIPALNCVGLTTPHQCTSQLQDLDSDWGNQSSRPWMNPCMGMQKWSDLFIVYLEVGGTEHQGELWKTS